MPQLWHYSRYLDLSEFIVPYDLIHTGFKVMQGGVSDEF